MQSCSNELVVKFSNPKMSRIPMNIVMSLPKTQRRFIHFLRITCLYLTRICALIDVVYQPGKGPRIKSFNHRMPGINLLMNRLLNAFTGLEEDFFYWIANSTVSL